MDFLSQPGTEMDFGSDCLLSKLVFAEMGNVWESVRAGVWCEAGERASPELLAEARTLSEGASANLVMHMKCGRAARG